MMSYKSKILSRRILAGIFILYLLNFVTEGRLAGIFTLLPSLVINKFEFWRLITYPLSYGSAEAMLILAFTFFYLSPRLEQVFNYSILPVILLLLVCLEGLLHTLFFWKTDIPLAGLEGISFFIIALTTFLSPRLKIQFLFFRKINLALVSLSVVLVWATFKIVQIEYFSHLWLIPAFAASFGISMAAITYGQIYLLHRKFLKKKAAEKLEIPKPEELKLAMMAAKSKAAKLNAKIMDELYESEDSEFPDLSEDRLNQVLDKILALGKDSLTSDEIKFLDNYSKNL
ncbi:MAG: hypothetical protein HW421_3708 [Ignavibacteria bacterium]|nr:hypothetical protein [Ignavibacteria bacterium]